MSLTQCESQLQIYLHKFIYASLVFSDFLLCLWCNVGSAIGMELINQSFNFRFKFLNKSAFYTISVKMHRVQYYFYLILFSFIWLFKNLVPFAVFNIVNTCNLAFGPLCCVWKIQIQIQDKDIENLRLSPSINTISSLFFHKPLAYGRI